MNIGTTTQVFPRGGVAGRLPAMLVVTKCLPPCPGKAKRVLKTSQAQGCVMSCSCIILQWQAAMLGVSGCQAALRLPLGVKWEQGDWLHRGFLALTASCHFGSFSKAMVTCNPFGVGGCPFFPLGFSSFTRLHPPGVSVDVRAVSCLFLAM